MSKIVTRSAQNQAPVLRSHPCDLWVTGLPLAPQDYTGAAVTTENFLAVLRGGEVRMQSAPAKHGPYICMHISKEWHSLL